MRKYIVRPKLTSFRGQIDWVIADISNSKIGMMMANFYGSEKLARRVVRLLNKTNL